jgi:succinate dehydrogenase / fumarate reductase membrane anchor subunit
MNVHEKVMRSQLGRARGWGSAKAGVEHWWIQRITSMALAPLTLWFVYSVISLLGADQPAIAAWAGRPLNAALLLALILMTFHHAQLGLQVVYEDYVTRGLKRSTAILATKAAALLLGLVAALAVLKLFLASH